MQTNTSILALDVGGRRIGVALASRVACLPGPFTTLEQGEKLFDQIAQIINQENIDLIVIGLPRNLDGQRTQQTTDTEDFTTELKKHITIPTVFQDEALTSRYAKEELESRGRPYTKSDVDALAATYILKDYLTENVISNRK